MVIDRAKDPERTSGGVFRQRLQYQGNLDANDISILSKSID